MQSPASRHQSTPPPPPPPPAASNRTSRTSGPLPTPPPPTHHDPVRCPAYSPSSSSSTSSSSPHTPVTPRSGGGGVCSKRSGKTPAVNRASKTRPNEDDEDFSDMQCKIQSSGDKLSAGAAQVSLAT